MIKALVVLGIIIVYQLVVPQFYFRDPNDSFFGCVFNHSKVDKSDPAMWVMANTFVILESIKYTAICATESVIMSRRFIREVNRLDLAGGARSASNLTFDLHVSYLVIFHWLMYTIIPAFLVGFVFADWTWKWTKKGLKRRIHEKKE